MDYYFCTPRPILYVKIAECIFLSSFQSSSRNEEYKQAKLSFYIRQHGDDDIIIHF